MKRLLLAGLLILAAASVLHAASYVTQAVFSITSSTKTTTANLRVTPMGPKVAPRAPEGGEIIQTFLWQANRTQNLFLTKSTTVPLTDALCAWVQVDQDTKVAVNSESAYMILYSGMDRVVCFK